VKLADLPVVRRHSANQKRRAPRPPSAETRARQSANAKRSWADPQYRERVTAAVKQRMADPGVRERIGIAAKLGTNPAERARRSERAKRLFEARPDIQEKFRRRQTPGIKHSAETRARIGEAARRSWANPVYRKHVSEAVRAALARPEEKARRSKKAKAFWSRVKAALNAEA
jgi:hypothetical protein